MRDSRQAFFIDTGGERRTDSNAVAACQHEADIQLLESAARTVTDCALCISNEKCGEWWLDLLLKRVNLRIDKTN